MLVSIFVSWFPGALDCMVYIAPGPGLFRLAVIYSTKLSPLFSEKIKSHVNSDYMIISLVKKTTCNNSCSPFTNDKGGGGNLNCFQIDRTCSYYILSFIMLWCYIWLDLDTASMRDDTLLEQTTRYMIAAFLKQSNMASQALNGEHNSVLSEVYR